MSRIYHQEPDGQSEILRSSGSGGKLEIFKPRMDADYRKSGRGFLGAMLSVLLDAWHLVLLKILEL